MPPRTYTSPRLPLFAAPDGNGDGPTYASILRGSGLWTTDDVDRHDALDDINPLIPPPPWRRDAEASGSGSGREPEASGSGLSLTDLLGRADTWAGATDAARRSGYPNRAQRMVRTGLGSPQSDEELLPPTRRLYVHDNRTSDDLRVLGGSGASVTLARGGNNRRRRSLIDRIASRVGEELRRPRQVDGIQTSHGMKPTNEPDQHVPAVVQSLGIRKQRSNDSLDRKGKRRKLDAKPEPGPSRPSYLDYTLLDSSAPIPLEFLPPTDESNCKLEQRTRHAHLGPQAHITFTFIAPRTQRDTDINASALRTSRPIPVSCGIHYYEVEVVDAGEEGHMSVGWVTERVDLARLVGWEKGSWGWHGDDGKTFEGMGQGQDFGEKWGAGDVVGCGLDYTQKRAFFTKNGKLIAHRFRNLGPGLYPAIGLKTFRETVAVNFTGPFKYDIDAHVRGVRDKIWSNAMNTTVKRVPRVVDQLSPPGSPRPEVSTLDPEDKTLAALVLDHLSHYGYTSTLAATEKEMNRREWIERETAPPSSTSTPKLEDDPSVSSFPSDTKAIDWLYSRLTTRDDLPMPWKLLNELFVVPVELERRLRIYDLQVLFRKADGAEVEAIEQGRKLLQRCSAESWPADVEAELRSTFTMLAGYQIYTNNNRLANQLIDGIKKSRGIKARSHLDQAFAQTRLVCQSLAPIDPTTTFVNVNNILDTGSVEVKEEPE